MSIDNTQKTILYAEPFPYKIILALAVYGVKHRVLRYMRDTIRMAISIL